MSFLLAAIMNAAWKSVRAGDQQQPSLPAAVEDGTMPRWLKV